jgi:hypothetical protein
MSALATFGLAASAEAGVYTVYACQFPSGSNANTTGNWVGITVNNGSISDNCPRGGTASGSFAGGAVDGSVAQWEFRAPPNTRVQDYAMYRSAQVTPTTAPENPHFVIFEGEPVVAVETCNGVSGCTGRGNVGAGASTANRFERQGLSANRVGAYVRCTGNGANPNICNSGASFQLHRADVTVADSLNPEITAFGGTLVDPGLPFTGQKTLDVAATDKGGGVYQAIVELDGRAYARYTIDDNGRRCAEPFQDPAPCKGAASNSFTFDADSVPAGIYSLAVRVTDATGTNSATTTPIIVTTPGGECAATPQSGALQFRAGFGRRLRSTATIRYGRRPVIRGRLADPAGQPIAGASLCVLTQNRAVGARVIRRRSVTTDAQGRFSYRLTVGASRLVRFVYRVAGVADAADVNVRVRARPRLRVSDHGVRNGERVTFSGRPGGAPYPRSGVLVQLQSKRGKRWQTFATPRSNSKGRFRYRYRFTRTRGTRRYRFRARVPRQQNYPYATGGSRGVRVRVSG